MENPAQVGCKRTLHRLHSECTMKETDYVAKLAGFCLKGKNISFFIGRREMIGVCRASRSIPRPWFKELEESGLSMYIFRKQTLRWQKKEAS